MSLMRYTVDRAGCNILLNRIGYIGNGFYRSNNPTNSFKALKEVVVIWIRLKSHQVHLTVLQ